MKHAAVAALAELDAAEMEVALGGLSAEERRALDEHWPAWVHEGQLPPASEPSTGSGQADWRVWVLMAGRGFGKTRAGAEWVSEYARAHPEAAIALVAATADEVRAVMIEGRSGLLAVARTGERESMRWEPSRKRLVFAGGAEAFVYSAANPESLRGPEHHIAWCDELAKWPGPTRSGPGKGEAAWNNLQLGLRLGETPRTLVTTTPRGVPALKRILAGAGIARSGGASWDNPHVAQAAVEALVAEHGGTRFGRQELEGVLIEDVEGALWTRELIERSRQSGTLPRQQLRRIVVGVDPPAGAGGDACGIVVCGVDAQGVGYVVADMSVAGLSPDGWARRVAAAAEAWGAHRVVAEKNNGGDMVEAVLRGADAGLPVTLVHAADGKAARAEPVAVRFENGRAKFAGAFPELEDELAAFTYAGYAGIGSPDRADAMIWAMTELVVTPQRAPPRVRVL